MSVIMLLPLAPELSATTPAPDPAQLLAELAALRRANAALRTENGALRAENFVLHERIRELEARLGQTSANSSRPPSSDPPQTAARPKALRSGRKRGGQPGHRGAYRALLPVEQVDELLAVVLERCRHCQQPFPASTCHRRGRVWRHQVVELLPHTVRVTEYQMTVQGQFRLGQRSRQPFCGAAADRNGHLSPAGAAATGVPGGRWGSRGAGQPATISAPGTTWGLNGYSFGS